MTGSDDFGVAPSDDSASTRFGRAFADADPAGDRSEHLAAARVVARMFGGERPQSSIARYELRRPLGAGAMGEVWSAHDPELLRDVAIKIVGPGRLRPGGDDPRPAALERLRREARALAVLSHPHVVQIYDIVVDDSGSIYVVMELIDGIPLSDWLRLRRRSWPEVVEVFAQAGRGLAAAHAAGLVHRDFKPSNVLVAGDGRVRVGDFGLARALQSAPAAPRPSVAEAQELVETLGGSLTRTGALVGTPLYMAPEQMRGEAADERSDQYAFCVALYEALYGTRPFVGGLEGIVLAKVEGRIEPPPRERRVPAWLERAVVRGLAPAPADRWPQLADLVRVLERGSGGAHRRRGGTALVGAALVGAGLAFAFVERDAPCLGRSGLDEVWTPERRASIGLALADRSVGASRIEERLTDHAIAIARIEREVCAVPTPATDATLQCLRTAAARLDAAIDVLGEGGRDLTGEAEAIADALPDPARCREPAIPAAEVSAAVRARIDALSPALARASTLLTADRDQEALAIAASVRADIESHGLDVAMLLPQTDAIAGAAQIELGAAELGAARLSDAYFAAFEQGDTGIAFWSAKYLAMHYAELRMVEPAQRWLRHAEVVAERDPPEPAARAELHNARAVVLMAAGDLEEAEDELRDGLRVCEGRPCERSSATLLANLAELAQRRGDAVEAAQLQGAALDELARVFGAESPVTIGQRLQFVEALLVVGRPEDALAQLHVASALVERWLSPDGDVAMLAEDLAMRARTNTGDFDEALMIGRRALARIDARSTAPTLRHAGLMQDYAHALADVGRFADALRIYDRALATMVDLAPGSLEEALLRTSRGFCAALVGRTAAAIADHRAALAILETSVDPAHPFVAVVLTNEAMAERIAGHADVALERAARARDLSARTQGPGAPVTLEAEFEVAAAALALGRRDEAAAILARLLESIPAEDDGRARIEFAMARAIEPRDHDRAIELARSAYGRLAGQVRVVDDTTAAVVSAWLRAAA